MWGTVDILGDGSEVRRGTIRVQGCMNRANVMAPGGAVSGSPPNPSRLKVSGHLGSTPFPAHSLTRVRSQHSSQCTCQHWMDVRGIEYESWGVNGWRRSLRYCSDQCRGSLQPPGASEAAQRHPRPPSSHHADEAFVTVPTGELPFKFPDPSLQGLKRGNG